MPFGGDRASPERACFPIKINALDATCGGGSGPALAQNATVANSIVANAQNVAVIGHACSLEAPAWLPVYESAGS